HNAEPTIFCKARSSVSPYEPRNPMRSGSSCRERLEEPTLAMGLLLKINRIRGTFSLLSKGLPASVLRWCAVLLNKERPKQPRLSQPVRWLRRTEVPRAQMRVPEVNSGCLFGIAQRHGAKWRRSSRSEERRVGQECRERWWVQN